MSEDLLLLAKIKEDIPNNSWIAILQDKQLLKLHEMLKKGITNSEIIRTCQTIFNVKKRATLQELLPDLVRFRTKVLDDKSLLILEEAQKNKAAVQLANKLKGLTSRVDAFGRLSWLVDQQTQRVIKLLDIEAKTLPMDKTTDNIAMLDKMLHNLLKAQQELKLDDSTTITVETQDKLRGLVEGFKDDGETMIQATHRLLSLAEERSLILKLGDDGSYSINSKEEEKELVEVST
jgi:hypothetical protein